jgi:cyclopropane-fatty-acyl-phospholipid synthase
MFGNLAKRTASQDSVTLQSLHFFDELFAAAPIKPFAIRLWTGATWSPGSQPPHFTLQLKRPAALRRLLWCPSELSLGEAFVYDDFDILGDLETCFELADFLVGRQWKVAEKIRIGQKLLPLLGRQPVENGHRTLTLRGRAHSKERDAQAVSYHYNISNDFYRLWLDKRMVYSCAFFHSQDESLDQAQYRKLDYICRKLRLKAGDTLLDIGCGWGGLIIHAAKKYQVDALGITLSQAQAELASARIHSEGLEDQCRVEVCDYREAPTHQQFDKLVSVGMIEHVGAEKLPEYFQKAHQLLKPGGVFLNHGITESITNAPLRGPSFIDKYVFPDGELIPISTSLHTAEAAGFEVRDVECLREHYAMTLRHWVKRLEDKRDQAIAMTSSEIYRIWRIYMAGSAYGFETRRLGLYQSLLVKSGRQTSGLPLTRCDWYNPGPENGR